MLLTMRFHLLDWPLRAGGQMNNHAKGAGITITNKSTSVVAVPCNTKANHACADPVV